MTDPGAPSASNLIAAADECLIGHGYARLRIDEEGPAVGRFYEDPYGIVLISVFETWGELAGRWAECQASLVELISAHMSKSEAKAWDGYLVLLTPSKGPGGREGVEAIRYDTSRVRKVVADGEELQTIGAVEDVLLPLLPLQLSDGLGEAPSVLEILPELLVERGVEPRVATMLVGAFSAGEPLLEALHQLGSGE